MKGPTVDEVLRVAMDRAIDTGDWRRHRIAQLIKAKEPRRGGVIHFIVQSSIVDRPLPYGISSTYKLYVSGCNGRERERWEIGVATKEGAKVTCKRCLRSKAYLDSVKKSQGIG